MPSDVEKPLRSFLAGFKRHAEESLHLAFGGGTFLSRMHLMKLWPPLDGLSSKKMNRTSAYKFSDVTEIHGGNYAVSCAMPAWMPNPSQGDVAQVISSAIASSVSFYPAPVACLTYYFSKAKKSELLAAKLYLHCSIDETYTVRT